MNFLKHLRALALCAGAALAAGTATGGQITVSGEGRVERVPDMAVITLGVEHEAPSAGAAVARVAAGSEALLTALAEIGVAPRDLRTSTLSLSPLRNHRSQGAGAPEIIGFQARNEVTVRLRDLSRLPELLGRVTDEGGNRFRGLHFALQDPAPAIDEARRLAVADGRARAALYAEAAGVGLGALVSISDAATALPQPMLMARTASADMAMPIAEGELGLSASVTMVFEIID
ncbi:SIMPL domain-containing protein [Shimia sp.]|uniref:SIMPL domain-containing protein n=1 Tax=Shimia sp. TaxID=1954381 RepID=UPI003568DE0C